MIRSFLSFCLSIFKGTSQVRLENIFLRKQLEILARTSTRPPLLSSDRLFFSVMTDAFNSWKETVLVLKPETVIRWHQQDFRWYWRLTSSKEADQDRRCQLLVFNRHLWDHARSTRCAWARCTNRKVLPSTR
jgi:hypothetical protein